GISDRGVVALTVPVSIRGQNCKVLAAAQLGASSVWSPWTAGAVIVLEILSRPLECTMQRRGTGSPCVKKNIEPVGLVRTSEQATVAAHWNRKCRRLPSHGRSTLPVPDRVIAYAEVLSQLTERFACTRLGRLHARAVIGKPGGEVVP